MKVDLNFQQIFIFNKYFIISGITDNTIENPSILSKGRNAKLKTTLNRKPVFKECENYKPQVKEEQSAGAFVLQVIIGFQMKIVFLVSLGMWFKTYTNDDGGTKI